MTIVNASEFVKTHIHWTWETPDDADERSVAGEAMAAMFAITDEWLEIVALEARLGIYDGEIFTEGSTRPQVPVHLLRHRQPGNVRIDPMYRPVESLTPELDAASALAWIETKLSEERFEDTRYQLSLRELIIAGLRVRLPDGDSSEPLAVDCYAGQIEVPVDHGWVTAPADPPGVPSPVSLRITNLDGELRLVLEVFWSLWASDPQPVASIRDGLLRLQARGWHRGD